MNLHRAGLQRHCLKVSKVALVRQVQLVEFQKFLLNLIFESFPDAEKGDSQETCTDN
jgi:hypothetical protein